MVSLYSVICSTPTPIRADHISPIGTAEISTATQARPAEMACLIRGSALRNPCHRVERPTAPAQCVLI